jgi:hypothetical protein
MYVEHTVCLLHWSTTLGRYQGKCESAKQAGLGDVAFTVTQAITSGLLAANSMGVKPVLLSVGVDGFACRTDLIQSYLESPDVSFTFVLRLKHLNGIPRRFCVHHRGAYRLPLDFADLLKVLLITRAERHLQC